MVPIFMALHRKKLWHYEELTDNSRFPGLHVRPEKISPLVMYQVLITSKLVRHVKEMTKIVILLETSELTSKSTWL